MRSPPPILCIFFAPHRLLWAAKFVLYRIFKNAGGFSLIFYSRFVLTSNVFDTDGFYEITTLPFTSMPTYWSEEFSAHAIPLLKGFISM